MDEATRARYLADPNLCPFCESNDLEGGSVSIDDRHARQAITCLHCYAIWVDQYHLSDITDIDIPKK
ncbi:hypothetical protein QD172_01955 [Cobetia sp. 10Alg 146]|uniref:hypothetical protein n=1 Tax=Cobetia sp. 10Alg 146 TaxID=3040019 RepID=UPI00244ADD4A|nr:hypothetical protein [Cobetia sp. 10Alg 146]MDH2290015.1 hypothetical protein [Cobetia sp. 10Alg 146]